MSNQVFDKYQETLVLSHKGRADDNSDQEEWDDQDFLDLLDETESSGYREQRMQELSQMMTDAKSNVDRSTVQTLTDEAELFDLTTTTAASSGLLKNKRQNKPNVVVHFFDPNFGTCKLMDQRLEELAARHFNTTTFVRIAAANAPFLSVKLKIQVLPCVVAYINGVEVKRLLGFGELGNDPTKLDGKVLEAVLLRSGVLSRMSLTGSSKTVNFAGPSQSKIRGSKITSNDSDDDWD